METEKRTSYGVFVEYDKHQIYISIAGDTTPEYIVGDLMSAIYRTISEITGFKVTQVVRHSSTREQLTM